MHHKHTHVLCLGYVVCVSLFCKKEMEKETVFLNISLVINIYGWAGFDSLWVSLWITWVILYRHDSLSHTEVSLPWLYHDLPDTHTIYSRAHRHWVRTHQLSVSCAFLHWASACMIHLHLEQDPSQYPIHSHTCNSHRETEQWGYVLWRVCVYLM